MLRLGPLLLLLQIAFSLQSAILKTDPKHIDLLQWLPARQSGLCEGQYLVPPSLLSGVITSNANDDGSDASSALTYDNNMGCAWLLQGPPGYVALVSE
ncbi:hypothetical protein BC830DRAFT_1092383 [Chytriomyces sp. MP71]|nr:hypothetical protein BC830DRAFT_1092383 [Chytriomyces sp. MP71]